MDAVPGCHQSPDGVHAYNSAVKFFAPSGVHKQHLMVLGLSFLEVAYFFGGKFRDKCFTGQNKP